ncbi:HD-GYP domain, c-di-GMP phosphodiesterase class II (or its inactivated variant) [Balnearium lithotrophicum]|uniref:HD-GYP domain, c-di-GMP phosphodiesterase class II (Or its inactivated variant) n=1 Tax=Balnearium lithotrophicum TaxID=223788 RepID=A0A521AAL4_9BACT|nr:HD domain-containing phosphohydrolase [Balnearium lithotrophicum]SMO31761.1 HD-GYP domain, c-di-GMP phosphodiesterase class II (or its inactivated variant) [Balnearium lithotrophicum]
MKLDKYWLLTIISILEFILLPILSYFVTKKSFEGHILNTLIGSAESYVEVSAVSVGSKKRVNELIGILERAPYIEKVYLKQPPSLEGEFLIKKNLIFPDGKKEIYIALDKNFIESKSQLIALKTSLLLLLIIVPGNIVILYFIQKLYLKPLDRIRQDIKKISKGQLNKLPYSKNNDEFDRIRISINNMIEKIEQKNIKEEIISQFIHLLTIGKGFNGEFVSLIKKVLSMAGCDGAIIGIKDFDDSNQVSLRLIITSEGSKVFRKKVDDLEGIEPLLLEANREIETDKENILSSFEREIGIKHVFAIPLSSFSEILGFTIFFKKSKEPLSEENKNFLRNISRSIAISTQIRKLIYNLERKLQEEKELTKGIVESFVRGIEIRDAYTRGHSERVAYYSKRIAEELGLTPKEVEATYIAGLLHDIGKIGIPDSILLKPSKLTDEEYEIIKIHPELSYELLKHIEPLKDSLPGIRYHHERWNGSGYPEGLKENKIPIQARILAIADSFDAMTSNRIYRKGMEKREALKEISSKAGKFYDPDVVNVALRVFMYETPPVTSEEYYLSSELFKTLEERRLDYFLRDHLTGVFSRTALEFAFSVARERFPHLFAFTVDIRKLREINIKEGWKRGDYILKKTVELLNSELQNAVIVRYSGDNFLVFTNKFDSLDSVIRKLEAELQVELTYNVLTQINDIEQLKKELTKLEFET